MTRRATIVVVVLLTLLLSFRVCTLKLWGENIWLRLYNHQIVKNRYDKTKVPFARVGEALSDDMRMRALRICALCCVLTPSKLNDAYQAFNADQKGGAIYWNQLHPLSEKDATLSEDVQSVQRFARAVAETTTGKTLYPFAFSMWNTFVLKYTGTKGSFGWHYDSEDAEDYRLLFCVDRTSQCGTVEYRNSAGLVEEIDLDVGESYILRGSTTFHRVTNNPGPDDERVMLGFHFSETPEKVSKNLNYFASLAAWRLGPALSVWWNQDAH
jgi:hypothetical protein